MEPHAQLPWDLHVDPSGLERPLLESVHFLYHLSLMSFGDVLSSHLRMVHDLLYFEEPVPRHVQGVLREMQRIGRYVCRLQ
jgi:hypothetical protein